MQTLSVTEMIEDFSSGGADALLTGLYGGDGLDRQRNRYINALRAFQSRWGERQVVLLSAPGRAELGGNHTDHQQGRVLAAALTADLLCVASPREDMNAVLCSEGRGETAVDLEDVTPTPEEQNTTAALMRGMAAMIASQGIPVTGFDAYLCSDIPAGGGFSSSAALELLLGNLLCVLGGDALPPMELARLAQRTENIWFGKPCGLMDQCACALGGVNMLDFCIPSAPRAESIPFDFSARGLTLAAVSVGSSHADLSDEYAAIPAEMELVAREFGMKVLRFVEADEYLEKRGELARKLPERALLRAEHFFGENERVLRMAEALRREDTASYMSEMLASGFSSRDKLQNVVPASHPEERRLAAALERSEALLSGKGAWRVHGGGFGGSLLALMPSECWESYRREMDALCGEGAARELRIREQGVIFYPQKQSC